MTVPWNPLQRATATAQRQHGAIALAQALGAGLSDPQVRTLTGNGLWTRRARGVFVVTGSPDTPRQRAWIAFLATRHADGVLSHLTAAAFHEVLRFAPLPHVTTRPGSSPRCGVAKVHRSVVPLVDRSHRDGLVLTSVSRTLVDLAGIVDRPTLEESVDVALCSKRATAASVEAAAQRLGPTRRGLDHIRSVIAVWSPRIEPGSVAEVRLLRQLVDLGLTTLVTQHEVYDETGTFVARLDLADPLARRGLEYDGVLAHNPRNWQRDEPRYERLALLGWDIRSVSKLDLLPGEPRLTGIASAWARRAA